MISVTGDKTGWNAWTENQASLAKDRYETRQKRLDREALDNTKRLAVKAQNKAKALDLESASTDADKNEIERKRAIIAAAMARAKEKLK
jgi:electron transport complex protein RnfB